MKKWDVFISHASEDKQTVALPLANSLARCGLEVWLDRFELRIGDSLREKIDEGLAESAFGVVILSEHFLNKGWPKNELNGLFALEEGGVRVILPVWHGVDKPLVAKYSPMLADRLAADTTQGIPVVTQMIAQVVLEDGAKVGRRNRSLAKQFIAILNQRPSPLNVSTFLTTYPRVLRFMLNSRCETYKVQPDFDVVQPDLTVATAGTLRTWVHCFFCSAQGPFFARGKPTGELGKAIEKIKTLMKWLPAHPQKIKRALGVEYRHQRHFALVLAGRRDALSDRDRQSISRLKRKEFEVRTYDRIIEACIEEQRLTRRAKRSGGSSALRTLTRQAQLRPDLSQGALKQEADPAQLGKAETKKSAESPSKGKR